MVSNIMKQQDVQLEQVTNKDRRTLWNLLQYMLFETSPSGKNVANEDGLFVFETREEK